MALLPVPALPQDCRHTHSPWSQSLRGVAGTSYPSLKFFLHRPTQFCNRGYKLAKASSIAEVERNSQQRRTQSPKHFRDSGSSSSSTTTTKRKLPPWRTPWKPSQKKNGPSRGGFFSQQTAQRGWRSASSADTESKNVECAESSSNSLAQRTAMSRIVEKLREIQSTFESTDIHQGESYSSEQNAEADNMRVSLLSPTRTAGELFLPKPNQNLFSIGNYWSTPDHPVPAPGRGVLETKFPWEFEEQDREEEEEEKKKRVKPPTLAELIIPPDRLRRLRTLGIALTNPIRVGRLGITDNIADKIIGQWCSSELVKVKCGGPAAVNMMKIHKDLERKTGGLVVWRAGSVAVVYRGSDYDMVNKVPSSLDNKLDRLLSSGHYIRSTLHKENYVQSKKGLSEGSEATLYSERNSESAGLPSNGVCNYSKKDATPDPRAIVADSSSSIHGKGILPSTDDAEDTHKTIFDSQVDANTVLQPLETDGREKDCANKAPGIGFSARMLNVAPDPFVDRDYEIEIDGILDGLGPRCKDWTGRMPVPVDADLLPALIPNYRPPYRLLPYGVKPQLTNNEQTDLRRLVRHIAPHFVLGRNKGQQGLAAAILKLWERSEVAKIAIKAGVQNTSSEKMAEELKRCTGGVLLARDRYFITLYRGKDFLPQQVGRALTERTSMLRSLKEGDEVVEGGISTINQSSIDILKRKAEQGKVKVEAEKAHRLTLAKQLEEKLALAVEKKGKAEKDLEMLEAISTPVEKPIDSETITEEEKYMFRRLGLKMGPFLLIGRRGVFDGVVENMHLHWKHRELVKLIVKERDRVQLQKIAKMLEYESGGILITVEGTSKGHAIIIYRGKNYQRPALIRPNNLLNKKKALERSLEAQRRASLSRHISALEQEINKLKASLSDVERTKDDILDAALNECSISSSDIKKDGIPEDEQACTDTTGGVVTGEEMLQSVCTDRKALLKLVELGPIYRATRLTNLERLKLRKLALKLGVGARFNVGKSNALVGFARAIRIHFLRHSLVVIGVKNRGRGTSVQDLVHDLEDLTGGVLVSQEQTQIIMYRGWPKGQKMPTAGSVEELSPELLAALEAEEEDWDMVDVPYMKEVRDVSDDQDDNMFDDVSYVTDKRDASDDDDAGYDNVEDHASMLTADMTGTDAEDGHEFTKGLEWDMIDDASDDDEDGSGDDKASNVSDDDDHEDLVSMLTANVRLNRCGRWV